MKVNLLIYMRLDGIDMLSIAVYPKELFENTWTCDFSAKSTFLRFSQLRKAESLISITLAGMYISSSDLHSTNASLPIEDNLEFSGIFIFLSFTQL